MDAPPPLPAAAPTPISRSQYHTSQRALAIGFIILAAIFIYRVYSPRLTARPSDPRTIACTVDLNTADRVQLIQVPGIGDHLADAILSHRTNHGPFQRAEDLQQVHGIGPRTWENIKPHVSVDRKYTQNDVLEKLKRTSPEPSGSAVSSRASNKIQRGDPLIDINTADESEFTRLPGIGPVLAARIVDTRGTGFTGIDDLKRVRGIGNKTLEAVRPFVKVNQAATR